GDYHQRGRHPGARSAARRRLVVPGRRRGRAGGGHGGLPSRPRGAAGSHGRGSSRSRARAPRRRRRGGETRRAVPWPAGAGGSGMTAWVLSTLSAVLVVAALLLLVPVLVLALQVVCAVAGHRRAEAPASGVRPRLAVLVPAHNEAAGIAAALATMTAQLQPGDRLLVVADNCSDDTARVAAVAGAEVAERHDLQRRGK